MQFVISQPRGDGEERERESVCDALDYPGRGTEAKAKIYTVITNDICLLLPDLAVLIQRR